MPVPNRIVLEPAAQDLADATAKPPFLFDLGPEGARKVLDDLQAAPVGKLPINDQWVTVPAEAGEVRVRIVKPADAGATPPVIVYMHGGGWILGNAGTHDRLVRELAVGARAAVAFVEYTPSPRPAIRSPSNRATPRHSGSLSTAPPTVSTPAGWRSRANRSAAT